MYMFSQFKKGDKDFERRFLLPFLCHFIKIVYIIIILAINKNNKKIVTNMLRNLFKLIKM